MRLVALILLGTYRHYVSNCCPGYQIFVVELNEGCDNEFTNSSLDFFVCAHRVAFNLNWETISRVQTWWRCCIVLALNRIFYIFFYSFNLPTAWDEFLLDVISLFLFFLKWLIGSSSGRLWLSYLHLKKCYPRYDGGIFDFSNLYKVLFNRTSS